ncbi:MAG TPA: hypothetical protein K8V51_04465 [Campylobacter avium]|uniref:hypothetical protein n=1 Tax=Campylobacter avium TaxID=522485 RepID=UPI001D53AC88|nr:hypothetical protein [Campylobacter avium]HJE66299.1 hypothetical protein [Campylobacter avium]
MLAVIKNEARDNDDVANEALKAAGSYIGIYVAIASLPDILIPLGKYLKKLKGSNNISPTQEEQALLSSEQQGRRQSEALDSTTIDGNRAGQSLSSDEADIQATGRNVSSSRNVGTDNENAGFAQHN